MSEIYAGRVREAMAGAIDTRKLAEAWAALHPKEFASKGVPGAAFARGHGSSLESPAPEAGSSRRARTPLADGDATKAISPVLSQFLAAAARAIQAALRRVLPGAWTEGWALGRLSAQASVRAAQTGSSALEAVDWGSWMPGDVEAAYQVAGSGLRDLLASQDVNIKSIAASRLEELGNVLAEYAGSPETERPLTGPVPPVYSVEALERELKGVLDSPERAYMVAHTEIARAAQAAATETYREMGVAEVRISTAGDERVCPVCEAAEARGPVPVGTITVPLHPLCRCATVAALAPLRELAGAS